MLKMSCKEYDLTRIKSSNDDTTDEDSFSANFMLITHYSDIFVPSLSPSSTDNEIRNIGNAAQRKEKTVCEKDVECKRWVSYGKNVAERSQQYHSG